MSDLGAEVSYHKFHPPQNHFHPLHFFSSPHSGIIGENFSCSSYGVNTVGIIRSPRGDGKEAIVLVTPYNFGRSDSSETLSLSIAYSVFSLLSRVTWLAKDIIWLIADSQYGEHESVAAWLRDYHTPSFTGLVSLNADACVEGNNLYISKDNSVVQGKISDGFGRAGTMAAALVLKVTDRNGLWDDTLSIYAEASNGQMPNLDLINIVNYLAVGDLSVAFYDLSWISKLIEGVIRSVNNLLEKFHQSFFLYLLTSPSKFVSVGVYMIAFALLVAPLPLVAASLYADANEVDFGMKNDKYTPIDPASNEINITFRSWKWLSAAKEVFVVHIWGVIVLLLPYFICQMRDWSPTTSFVSWVFLAMLSLLILYLILGSPFSHGYSLEKGEWAMLKSVTISAVFIGLLLMSVVNFATAEIGALMVPMCLMAQPLKPDIRAASLRSFFRVICNLVLGFVAFPPVTFLC
ncbi:hypothetical protein GH714_041892 [Hevea brasiliensis]|uniref:Uncharacterized protein n=1 Tax=Hevea brasiliensis TaxID=3981 RepID=A0A6A6MRW1_HEVBR|nr:hypothetical protein GH714_041892 [Hevea brasiliensis]